MGLPQIQDFEWQGWRPSIFYKTQNKANFAGLTFPLYPIYSSISPRLGDRLANTGKKTDSAVTYQLPDFLDKLPLTPQHVTNQMAQKKVKSVKNNGFQFFWLNRSKRAWGTISEKILGQFRPFLGTYGRIKGQIRPKIAFSKTVKMMFYVLIVVNVFILMDFTLITPGGIIHFFAFWPTNHVIPANSIFWVHSWYALSDESNNRGFRLNGCIFTRRIQIWPQKYDHMTHHVPNWKKSFFHLFFEKLHDSRPGTKNFTQNTSTHCASNTPTFDSLK